MYPIADMYCLLLTFMLKSTYSTSNSMFIVFC